VLVVVTAAQADKRYAWFKAFKDPAALVDCAAPGGKGVISFIGSEAKAQGLTLEAGVAELLAERIGPQLLLLRHELTKVSLLAGPGNPVERSHVEASTNHIAEESVWDLMDAIGSGRVANSLVLLGRLEGTGAAAPAILGSLASHFRKLARLRSGATIAAAPFVVRKLERQARRFTLPRLVGCLKAIHETDTALKGAGALPPEAALERLVIGLAS
jgi:DNA polymerase-3 subunit delta